MAHQNLVKWLQKLVNFIGDMSKWLFWIGKSGSVYSCTGVFLVLFMAFLTSFPLSLKSWAILVSLYLSPASNEIVTKCCDKATYAQLLTIPIYVSAAGLTVVVAFIADRTGRRSSIVGIGQLIMLVGFIMTSMFELFGS